MGRNVITVTARNIYSDLTHKLTLTDLQSKYELSDSELTALLHRIFPNDRAYAEISSKFAANQQLRDRHIRNNERRQRNAQLRSLKNDKVKALEQAHSETDRQAKLSDADSSNPPQRTILEDLRAEESQILDEIASQKEQYLAIINQYHLSLESMRTSLNAAEQAKIVLQCAVTEYYDALKSCQHYATKLHFLSEVRRTSLSRLKQTRQKIEAETVIVFYAYENGTFEPVVTPDSTIDSTPDDSDYESIIEILTKRSDCEDLRIKDIRLLARALCISQHARHRVTFVFETNGLEELYTTLATDLAEGGSNNTPPPAVA